MWRGGCACVDGCMCLHVFTVTVGTYAHVYACNYSKREICCILQALHLSSFSDIAVIWPGACHSAALGICLLPIMRSLGPQPWSISVSEWVFVCVRVCVYLCMFVYVYVCLCVCVWLRVHIGIHCVNIKDLFRCLLQVAYVLRQDHSTSLGLRIQLE